MPWAFTPSALVQATNTQAAHQAISWIALRERLWVSPDDSIGGCIHLAISHNSRSIGVPNRQRATVHRGPEEISICLPGNRISESTS